jgi:serine/threonine protein kinase
VFLRGQIIGKYKIHSTIGSGGFGTVFLAEDTWIDKKVALKVPHKQNLDFGELLREPRLLASLSHPNIVTILTAEKQENIFFIVMEYVHGPSNVLVSDSGLVKVADFGTSRFLEIAAHGTTVIGSPPYMAPEQFQGKAIFASDLYSLGVTMFQMLTGDLPYDTPSPSDLERLQRGELLVAPRLRNPRIPKAINDVVLKAMAPDITQRYQRAGDVLDDVLGARNTPPRRAARSGTAPEAASEPAEDIQSRLRARETPQARFCWHCRKPLHARSDKCPFCGENQS